MAIGISIIVPSKGRVKLLGELIESLSVARNNYPGPSELIIVDDSNEEDARAVRELCRQYNATMVYYSPSVSGKRNKGAELARHEIVLFLDSDCLATPGLLAYHAAKYADPRVGGVLGLLEFVGEDTWFWQAVNNSPFVISFSFPKWLETVPWGPSANLSFRKTVFFALGGFDEGFPNKPGGEDVDLGLRLTKANYILACSAQGLVYHSKETWIPVKDMFKRLWHYGSADYYLMQKHPDYTMAVLPRRSLVCLLGSLVLLGLSLIRTPLFATLIPAWLLFELAVTALLTNLFSKDKHAPFLQQLVVQQLLLVNEMGFMWRALVKGKPSFWFRQMVYFDGQMEGIQCNGSLKVCAQLISFAALLALVLLI